MGIFILSARGITSSVSSDELFQFENIVSQTCDAQILSPKANEIYRWSNLTLDEKRRGFALKLCNRAFSRYNLFGNLQLPNESNLLLLGGIHGDDINLLTSIPNWRKRFDCVAAYICDSWEPWIYPSKIIREIDHLFVPMPEMVQELTEAFQIPVTCVPFGAAAYDFCKISDDRPIDLISFGRMPEHHHDAFVKKFSQPGSSYRYLRTTPRSRVDFPLEPYEQRSDLSDLQELYRLLQQSKLALCYESVFSGMRKFPHSFVTMRWFEAGAAGCVIVGKRPTTPLAAKLLDWENATIELPDDGDAAAEVIVKLLQDLPRLQEISLRNTMQHLARHDWRWRISQMLEVLEVPQPPTLQSQLAEIKARTSPFMGSELAGWRKARLT
jgi:hypothetical protein